MSVGGLATETLAEAVRHASTWLELKRLSTTRKLYAYQQAAKRLKPDFLPAS